MNNKNLFLLVLCFHAVSSQLSSVSVYQENSYYTAVSSDISGCSGATTVADALANTDSTCKASNPSQNDKLANSNSFRIAFTSPASGTAFTYKVTVTPQESTSYCYGYVPEIVGDSQCSTSTWEGYYPQWTSPSITLVQPSSCIAAISSTSNSPTSSEVVFTLSFCISQSASHPVEIILSNFENAQLPVHYATTDATFSSGPFTGRNLGENINFVVEMTSPSAHSSATFSLVQYPTLDDETIVPQTAQSRSFSVAPALNHYYADGTAPQNLTFTLEFWDHTAWYDTQLDDQLTTNWNTAAPDVYILDYDGVFPTGSSSITNIANAGTACSTDSATGTVSSGYPFDFVTPSTTLHIDLADIATGGDCYFRSDNTDTEEDTMRFTIHTLEASAWTTTPTVYNFEFARHDATTANLVAPYFTNTAGPSGSFEYETFIIDTSTAPAFASNSWSGTFTTTGNLPSSVSSDYSVEWSCDGGSTTSIVAADSVTSTSVTWTAGDITGCTAGNSIDVNLHYNNVEQNSVAVSTNVVAGVTATPSATYFAGTSETVVVEGSGFQSATPTDYEARFCNSSTVLTPSSISVSSLEYTVDTIECGLASAITVSIEGEPSVQVGTTVDALTASFHSVKYLSAGAIGNEGILSLSLPVVLNEYERIFIEYFGKGFGASVGVDTNSTDYSISQVSSQGNYIVVNVTGTLSSTIHLTLTFDNPSSIQTEATCSIYVLGSNGQDFLSQGSYQLPEILTWSIDIDSQVSAFGSGESLSITGTGFRSSNINDYSFTFTCEGSDDMVITGGQVDWTSETEFTIATMPNTTACQNYYTMQDTEIYLGVSITYETVTYSASIAEFMVVSSDWWTDLGRVANIQEQGESLSVFGYGFSDQPTVNWQTSCVVDGASTSHTYDPTGIYMDDLDLLACAPGTILYASVSIGAVTTPVAQLSVILHQEDGSSTPFDRYTRFYELGSTSSVPITIYGNGFIDPLVANYDLTLNANAGCSYSGPPDSVVMPTQLIINSFDLTGCTQAIVASIDLYGFSPTAKTVMEPLTLSAFSSSTTLNADTPSSSIVQLVFSSGFVTDAGPGNFSSSFTCGFGSYTFSQLPDSSDGTNTLSFSNLPLSGCTGNLTVEVSIEGVSTGVVTVGSFALETIWPAQTFLRDSSTATLTASYLKGVSQGNDKVGIVAYGGGTSSCGIDQMTLMQNLTTSVVFDTSVMADVDYLICICATSAAGACEITNPAHWANPFSLEYGSVESIWHLARQVTVDASTWSPSASESLPLSGLNGDGGNGPDDWIGVSTSTGCASGVDEMVTIPTGSATASVSFDLSTYASLGDDLAICVCDTGLSTTGTCNMSNVNDWADPSGGAFLWKPVLRAEVDTPFYFLKAISFNINVTMASGVTLGDMLGLSYSACSSNTMEVTESMTPGATYLSINFDLSSLTDDAYLCMCDSNGNTCSASGGSGWTDVYSATDGSLGVLGVDIGNDMIQTINGLSDMIQMPYEDWISAGDLALIFGGSYTPTSYDRYEWISSTSSSVPSSCSTGDKAGTNVTAASQLPTSFEMGNVYQLCYNLNGDSGLLLQSSHSFVVSANPGLITSVYSTSSTVAIEEAQISSLTSVAAVATSASLISADDRYQWVNTSFDCSGLLSGGGFVVGSISTDTVFIDMSQLVIGQGYDLCYNAGGVSGYVKQTAAMPWFNVRGTISSVTSSWSTLSEGRPANVTVSFTDSAEIRSGGTISIEFQSNNNAQDIDISGTQLCGDLTTSSRTFSNNVLDLNINGGNIMGGSPCTISIFVASNGLYDDEIEILVSTNWSPAQESAGNYEFLGLIASLEASRSRYSSTTGAISIQVSFDGELTQGRNLTASDFACTACTVVTDSVRRWDDTNWIDIVSDESYNTMVVSLLTDSVPTLEDANLYVRASNNVSIPLEAIPDAVQVDYWSSSTTCPSATAAATSSGQDSECVAYLTDAGQYATFECDDHETGDDSIYVNTTLTVRVFNDSNCQYGWVERQISHGSSSTGCLSDGSSSVQLTCQKYTYSTSAAAGSFLFSSINYLVISMIITMYLLIH